MLAFARILAPSLAAWLRARPELRGEPLAVLDIDEHTSPEARLRAPVHAVSPEAAARGIAPGLTGAQARSVAPGVRTLPRSPDQERSALAALRDAAWSISPRVESAADGVYADLDGLGRLHPTRLDAARALLRAAAAVAVPVRIGVASSKPLALLASLHGDAPIADLTAAPTGSEPEERAFLASLPVASLVVWIPSLAPAERPGAALRAGRLDAAALVASFGLTSLGELAALPRGALAERLGRDGELLEALARGEHRPPLVPLAPSITIEESLELEGYLETFEPLAFLLRPALERLVRRLALRGLGCASLELHLSLDPGGTDARTVTVSVPTRDVGALLALVRLSLDARPPGAPVDGFRVVAHAGELRPTQLSLFAPAGPAPEALSTTLARLEALVGPERVGSPRVPWTRRPGVVELEAFALEPPPVFPEEPPPRCPVRALRRVCPPAPVEVETDAQGRPTAVSLDGQRRRVLRAEGPYVVEGGWWSEEAYCREERDVTLAPRSSFEGPCWVRLVREVESGLHYVDAVYDG